MLKKVCRKCDKEKDRREFYKNKKIKDGLNSYCKECCKENVILSRGRNKEHYQKVQREYCLENKDRIDEYNRQYRTGNKEKLKDLNAKYYQENKQNFNKYYKERKENDPLYKLTSVLRSMVSTAFSRNNYTKRSKTYKILGASFEEVLEHLNENPYSFIYGDTGLDVDHIIPLAEAENEESVIKLNHYTNLQLLPSTYNRDIKKDKPFDKAHFEDWLELHLKSTQN